MKHFQCWSDSPFSFCWEDCQVLYNSWIPHGCNSCTPYEQLLMCSVAYTWLHILCICACFTDCFILCKMCGFPGICNFWTPCITDMFCCIMWLFVHFRSAWFPNRLFLYSGLQTDCFYIVDCKWHPLLLICSYPLPPPLPHLFMKQFDVKVEQEWACSLMT